MSASLYNNLDSQKNTDDKNEFLKAQSLQAQSYGYIFFLSIIVCLTALASFFILNKIKNNPLPEEEENKITSPSDRDKVMETMKNLPVSTTTDKDRVKVLESLKNNSKSITAKQSEEDKKRVLEALNSN